MEKTKIADTVKQHGEIVKDKVNYYAHHKTSATLLGTHVIYLIAAFIEGQGVYAIAAITLAGVTLYATFFSSDPPDK